MKLCETLLTNLRSSVINYISNVIIQGKQGLQNAEVMVYFYFTFADQSKQHLHAMILSFLAQILSSIASIPSIVLEKLKEAKTEDPNLDNPPSSEHARKLLTAVLLDPGISRIYIAIDSLDESAEPEKLVQWISSILGTPQRNKIHFIASSRALDRDIHRQMDEIINTDGSYQNTINLDDQVKNIEQDIKVYVEENLKEDPALKRWSVVLKNEVKESLLTGSQGMCVLHHFPHSGIEIYTNAG